MMQPHGVGVLYFTHNAETAVSQSASQPAPLVSLSQDNRKIVSGAGSLS
jgi:hypothetical protein